MTGIFAVFKFKKLNEELNKNLIKSSFKLKHRGISDRTHFKRFPIELVVYHKNKNLEHKSLHLLERDLNYSFIVIDGNIFNLPGERYDGFLKREILNAKPHILSNILKEFKIKGKELFNKIRGSYSGVLYNGESLIGFKDPVGAKPLYYCKNKDFIIFASELKALAPFNENIVPVSPGTIVSSAGYTEEYYTYPKFISPKGQKFY